jgi:hypothetical protein
MTFAARTLSSPPEMRATTVVLTADSPLPRKTPYYKSPVIEFAIVKNIILNFPGKRQYLQNMLKVGYN